MEKLLILDSNSILNRAFYGIRYLATADGTPTNAIYGFINILIKLVNEIKPDYICAAFDVHAPTFRHKMFDDYKATRHATPDGLIAQMPIAKDILKAMSIPVLELAGYEADDIIGTVSRICEENKVECYIATGDKDDLQLASDITKVVLTVTKSGSNDTTIYDDKAVFERYRVSPKEFIDVKALMGDSSDNIPGVKGIGEKTAMSLIEKYHNIEYIFDNLPLDLKGATLKKLEEGKEIAYLSKELATIIRDVPLTDFKISDCQFRGFSNDATSELYPLLNSLELSSIIKKLGIKPDDNTSTLSVDIYEGTTIKEITSGSELCEILKNADEIAFVPQYNSGGLINAGFAIGKTAYYTSGLTQEELNSAFCDILTAGKFIACDIKDFIVAINPFIDITSLKFDVAIAAYLINPSKSQYTLDDMAESFLGVTLDKSEEKQLSLFDEDNETADILAKRALSLIPLRDYLLKELEKNGQTALYYDIELPLISVLAHMQLNGFLVDKDELTKFSDMLSKKIDALTKEIYFLAGEEFNINSPKQLGVILFEKMGLKPAKKTKSGYSTNADALDKLKDKSPIIGFILEYRQYAKLKSTYCDGLSAVINPKTHRIHSIFTQTVTVTGRISSTEPNLQNIPTRTELGREIRKMFVAKEGCVLVDADYSQIELRVLSDIANDKIMQQAFLDGEDIHAVTASQVLGVPLNQITPDQRRSAKAVNFGIVYGIGEFSLANDLGISFHEAKAYIEGYLEKYSGVHEYMNTIKEQAKEKGFVKTLMNRIRYIPEIKSSNPQMRKFGERVALNTPIQGTAADIIKLAMVKVFNRLHDEGLKSKLILQVHDELIIEAPHDEVEAVKKILKEEMQGAMELKVPLIVDMSTGHSWYDAK